MAGDGVALIVTATEVLGTTDVPGTETRATARTNAPPDPLSGRSDQKVSARSASAHSWGWSAGPGTSVVLSTRYGSALNFWSLVSDRRSRSVCTPDRSAIRAGARSRDRTTRL